ICAFWPTGTLPKDAFQPVHSTVPTLVLSGELDPVTPPARGTEVSATLSSSRHLIAPGVGHGVSSQGCVPRLIAALMETGNVGGLDTSCMKGYSAPPFFLSFAGPPP
ncbi:MAG TPA: alpha/beta hydrolase, partial [Myxococcaceae bacterium]|nr:alpha/beta hydrolase [Myxococcaceae bacterium]